MTTTRQDTDTAPYYVRTMWEGDIMTLSTHDTLDEALSAADEAVRTADTATIERGIYGDTIVSVYDEQGTVYAEHTIPGVDHRPTPTPARDTPHTHEWAQHDGFKMCECGDSRRTPGITPTP